MERVSNAIRLSEPTEVSPEKELPEILMVGGEGRIYYTTEHFAFSLLADGHDHSDSWTFLLDKWTSWQHT